MARLQRWGCAVCGKEPKRFVIDHEHAPGWKWLDAATRRTYVRGLTCDSCNHYVLTRYADANKHRQAAEYLDRYAAYRAEQAKGLAICESPLTLTGFATYEWERTARYMLREYRGCKGLESQSTHWNWIQERVLADDWDWLWTEGVELGLFRYGHCVAGSIIGLRTLVANGHSILAVTHRPSDAVPDTLAWLAYQQIPWTEVHILSNGEPKSSIKADVLVDDKIENVIEWCHEPHNKAIIYNRAWNVKWHGFEMLRANSWREVIEHVEVLRSAGAE